MYHHHIQEMARAIVEVLQLKSEQEALVEQAIQACWLGKIAIVWSVEDIQIAAEQNHNCHFIEKDAVRILKSLLENHDAELGSTWDTLCWCIGEAIENGVDIIPISEEVEDET